MLDYFAFSITNVIGEKARWAKSRHFSSISNGRRIIKKSIILNNSRISLSKDRLKIKRSRNRSQHRGYLVVRKILINRKNGWGEEIKDK